MKSYTQSEVVQYVGPLLRSHVVVVYGGYGTGKSTLISKLSASFDFKHKVYNPVCKWPKHNYYGHDCGVKKLFCKTRYETKSPWKLTIIDDIETNSILRSHLRRLSSKKMVLRPRGHDKRFSRGSVHVDVCERFSDLLHNVQHLGKSYKVSCIVEMILYSDLPSSFLDLFPKDTIWLKCQRMETKDGQIKLSYGLERPK